MTPEGWGMVVLLSVGAAGLLALLVRRLWLDGQRVPVPGYLYVYCEGAPPEEVAWHLALAFKWMAAAFPGRHLSMALAGWTVVVMSAEEWKRVRPDGTVGRVGGYLDAAALRLEVGPSFDGLAHEVAHLLEEAMRGRTDMTHATWEDNGIAAAIAGYQQERRTRRA